MEFHTFTAISCDSNFMDDFKDVDDTFVIWLQGSESEGFLTSTHHNTQFTMETEKDGRFQVLDVDIYRRQLPPTVLRCTETRSTLINI
jgi:hypothetical protein